jgi:hypothetical protein
MDSFINNDDDMPVLSGYALEALQSFLSEQQKQQERFDAMKEAAEQRFNELTSDTSSDDTTASMSEWSMDLFQEDWQVSHGQSISVIPCSPFVSLAESVLGEYAVHIRIIVCGLTVSAKSIVRRPHVHWLRRLCDKPKVS